MVRAAPQDRGAAKCPSPRGSVRGRKCSGLHRTARADSGTLLTQGSVGRRHAPGPPHPRETRVSPRGALPLQLPPSGWRALALVWTDSLPPAAPLGSSWGGPGPAPSRHTSASPGLDLVGACREVQLHPQNPVSLLPSVSSGFRTQG